MKLTAVIIPIILAAAAYSCRGSHYPTNYDASTCEDLAVKIDSGDSLTQADYTVMIGQSEQIMKYLIEESEKINDMPDSAHYSAWRILLAEPEYMERFSYMFTLGSALFEADRLDKLDKKNRELYSRLDHYNEQLAAISDRN